tara:strand:- start:200 stop:406 length:207 start_codon:yes stop_codon:yes gene_type:complete
LQVPARAAVVTLFLAIAARAYFGVLGAFLESLRSVTVRVLFDIFFKLGAASTVVLRVVTVGAPNSSTI